MPRSDLSGRRRGGCQEFPFLIGYSKSFLNNTTPALRATPPREEGKTIDEERGMARIRHIAIQTQDEEATARFYCENFGLTKVRKLESERTSGYYLTDGHINVAVLRFKNDAIAGTERGRNWSGIHHIGFQVESLEDMVAKLEQSGAAKPRADINAVLATESVANDTVVCVGTYQFELESPGERMLSAG